MILLYEKNQLWHGLLEPASSWLRGVLGRYDLTPEAAKRCFTADVFQHKDIIPQKGGILFFDDYAPFMADIVAHGDNRVPVAYHMVAARLLSFCDVVQLLMPASWTLPAIACSKYALEFALSQSFGSTPDSELDDRLLNSWTSRLPTPRPGIPRVAQLVSGLSPVMVPSFRDIEKLSRATHRHILCELVNKPYMKHVHVADHTRVTDIVTSGPHSWHGFYG